MLSNGNSKNCGFDDVMVSYIYDEIDTAERRKFEVHLVDCSMCTDEFAELSGARFSVFEWQKEAFAELPTPQIDIPYVGSRDVGSRAPVPQNTGFFSGLRGLFGGFAVPLAAAVLICLGVGFAALMLPGGNQELAGNVAVDQPEIFKAPSSTTSEQKMPVYSTNESDVTSGDVPRDIPVVSRDLKPAKVMLEFKRSKPSRQLTAGIADSKRRNPSQARKAPALSNFDDADDKSLRLTDLFDEGIGSIR